MDFDVRVTGLSDYYICKQLTIKYVPHQSWLNLSEYLPCILNRHDLIFCHNCLLLSFNGANFHSPFYRINLILVSGIKNLVKELKQDMNRSDQSGY